MWDVGVETTSNRKLVENRAFGQILEGGRGNSHREACALRGNSHGKVLHWACASPVQSAARRLRVWTGVTGGAGACKACRTL